MDEVTCQVTPPAERQSQESKPGWPGSGVHADSTAPGSTGSFRAKPPVFPSTRCCHCRCLPLKCKLRLHSFFTVAPRHLQPSRTPDKLMTLGCLEEGSQGRKEDWALPSGLPCVCAGLSPAGEGAWSEENGLGEGPWRNSFSPGS